MTAALKNITLKNISYTAAGKVITFLFTMAANIVLARHLASSDYGIVGFAMIFISFLTQFSDFGLVSAAIQRQELTEDVLYTGFTMKFLLSAAVFALGVA